MEPADLSSRLRAAPATVFVDLLREAGEALDARALKERLARRGVPPAAVEAAWRTGRAGIRRHANVAFDAVRGGYVYADGGSTVPALGPEEALVRLLPPRLTARKARLAELIRAALAERAYLADLPSSTSSASSPASASSASASSAASAASAGSASSPASARERQDRIDAARALAELAMEAEELASAGAGPAVLTERIRALARSYELTPVDRAGQMTTFDPARHTPVIGAVRAGSPVSVIRPGYRWRYRDEHVLLAKAQVVPVG